MLRLTIERQNLGLTKAKLGALSDIHPAQIGKFESGRTKPCKPEIERLGKVFNLPGELLFEEVKNNDCQAAI